MNLKICKKILDNHYGISATGKIVRLAPAKGTWKFRILQPYSSATGRYQDGFVKLHANGHMYQLKVADILAGAIPKAAPALA